MASLVIFNGDIAVRCRDGFRLHPGKSIRWQQHWLGHFWLLIKENPGSLEVVGVSFRKKIQLSVVTAASGSGQDLRGVRRVSTESARFAVIDVDFELPGLADIADEVIPGIIPVTPA